MFVIGSDSHTCSAESVSCLAIGLRVADVILPLITGETWFKIPETVEIRFVNKPKPGISAKDVTLYIFIGACTTTKEELVLAALVLEQAMKLGAIPKCSGKRKGVPGQYPSSTTCESTGSSTYMDGLGGKSGFQDAATALACLQIRLGKVRHG
jgi:homoaconitase/3-isopropylmalate dehydratase large subunit